MIRTACCTRVRKTYSFQNHRGKSRIDHIYIAERDRSVVKKSEILPYPYSDHNAVVATLDLASQVTADPKKNQKN